jgi:hypothetical protein
MTYTIAECTVNNAWWWTEELSEICRFSFQNKFEKLLHLVGFIIRKQVGVLLRPMKFEEPEARIRTPAHTADELFHCNVFASYSRCQQGEDRYFELNWPVQRNWMVLARNISVFVPSANEVCTRLHNLFFAKSYYMHIVNNRFVIMWGCFIKVKFHKRLHSVLKLNLREAGLRFLLQGFSHRQTRNLKTRVCKSTCYVPLCSALYD